MLPGGNPATIVPPGLAGLVVGPVGFIPPFDAGVCGLHVLGGRRLQTFGGRGLHIFPVGGIGGGGLQTLPGGLGIGI
jgi:hypothetical protein